MKWEKTNRLANEFVLRGHAVQVEIHELVLPSGKTEWSVRYRRRVAKNGVINRVQCDSHSIGSGYAETKEIAEKVAENWLTKNDNGSMLAYSVM